MTRHLLCFFLITFLCHKAQAQTNSFTLKSYQSGENNILLIKIKKHGGLKDAIAHIDSSTKAESLFIDTITRINISLTGTFTEIEEKMSDNKVILENQKDSTQQILDHHLIAQEVQKSELIKNLLQLFPTKKIDRLYVEKCFDSIKTNNLKLSCSRILICLKNKL